MLFISVYVSVHLNVCSCVHEYLETRRGHRVYASIIFYLFFEAKSLPKSGTQVFTAGLDSSKPQGCSCFHLHGAILKV